MSKNSKTVVAKPAAKKTEAVKAPKTIAKKAEVKDAPAKAAPKAAKTAAAKSAKAVKAPVKKAAAPKKIAVVFEADCPLATTVSVAGSFNDWAVDVDMLKKDKKTGLWTAKISLLPGDYEYKFVCDGKNWDEGENKTKHV
ncbi:MAG: glycogen-binding domain-containing protein [Fibrobacter sp.]|nr:glycogen-binding domain-containing protein [Fibrobacter sp.]